MLIVYTENVHRSFSPKDVYSLKQSPTETGPIETNKTYLEVYPPPAVCNNPPSCLDVYDKHTGLKSAAGSPERPDHLIPGFLGTCVCFFIPLMALANVLGLKPFKVMALPHFLSLLSVLQPSCQPWRQLKYQNKGK